MSNGTTYTRTQLLRRVYDEGTQKLKVEGDGGGGGGGGTTPAGTATPTVLSRSNTVQTMFEANPARLHAKIANNSDEIAYIYYGDGADGDANVTEILFAHGNWIMDYLYTGKITIVWASNGAGKANGTELTA